MRIAWADPSRLCANRTCWRVLFALGQTKELLANLQGACRLCGPKCEKGYGCQGLAALWARAESRVLGQRVGAFQGANPLRSPEAEHHTERVCCGQLQVQLQPGPLGGNWQRVEQGKAAGQVGDGLFVGRQARRPIAGLQMKGGCTVGQPGGREVPGQPGCKPTELIRRLLVKWFQRAPDRLVQVCPPHSVQVIVEVLLEQVMPKPIARESVRAHSLEADRRHQAVSMHQVTTQALEDRLLVHLHSTGDDLSREFLALDARGGQQCTAAVRQPADAFGNRRLHARRELVPMQRRPLRPAPCPRRAPGRPVPPGCAAAPR